MNSTDCEWPEPFRIKRENKIIAYGVIFSSGKCIVHWEGQYNSVVVWNSFEDLKNVNGHPGTEIKIIKYKI